MNDGLISGTVAIASRLAIQFLVFLVTIVATRALTITDFGIYSIASSLVVLSRNLFYVGPYEYLLKSPETPSLKGSCLLANLLIATLSAVVLAGIAFASPLLFGATEIRGVLLALIPSLFVAAVTAWFEALLLRRMKVRYYYGVTVSAEATSAAAAIVLLLLSAGLLSLVVQVYVRLLCMLVIYLVAMPERPTRRMGYAGATGVLRWSWLRYSTVFLGFASSYGADLVLGIVLSPAATGVYRAANRIVLAISDLFAQPLQKIILTDTSSRSARHAPPGGNWLPMFTGTAAIGWAVLAGMAVSAQDVVVVLLGEKWRVAAPVITVLCAVRALTLLDVSTSTQLVCYDRQKFMLKVQVAAALAILGISTLLAPLGPRAVAIGGGCVALTGSLLYCREAARIAAGSAREIAGAIGTALTPAAMVVAATLLLRWAIPLDPQAALAALLRALAGGAIGLALGLFLVRRAVGVVLRQLAPAGSGGPAIPEGA